MNCEKDLQQYHKPQRLTLSIGPALPKLHKMVFRALLASILILVQGRSIAQIEKLTTPAEVLQFVQKVVPPFYSPLSAKMGFPRIGHKSFDSLVKTYRLQSFEMVDLDGNGLTDLIFNGSLIHARESDTFTQPLSFAIFSFGKDSFYIRKLGLEGGDDIASHSIRIDGKPYIQTIRVTLRRVDTQFQNQYLVDTLVWKFNAFIEKGPIIKRKITKIDYNGWNGLAYDLNITLSIINDSVRLKKERIPDLDGMAGGGVYLARLDSNTNQKLYGLLDAIDFVRLKDSYSVEGYDMATGTLKITYDDGQTKRISDYGTCGTYGLAEIHQLMYGLSETQHWVNPDSLRSRCIGSLHTDGEVLGLVRTLGREYPFLEFEPDTPVDALPDYRERLTAFGERRWQKGDIDGNGNTDLLFNGYKNQDGESRQYSIVVLSYGNDSLRQQEISGAHGFFAAKIIKNNGHDQVAIRYLDAIEDSTQKKGYHLTAREDTLTAYEGQIMEIPPAALHKIERLDMHDEIGQDSVVVKRDAIYWYKNTAGTKVLKLADPAASQKLLSLAAGIRFERLNPELLLPNKTMRGFSSTWYFKYDGGKQNQFTSDDLIGSFRLQAMWLQIGDLKFYRTDWKMVSKSKVPTR